VIERLINLSGQCRLEPLIGNHEIMFLASREDESQRDFWLHFGGRETLESYGNEMDAIPDDHVKFMAKCRSFYETDEHIFLHANYVPTVPLEKQPEYVLFWEHLDAHAPAPHVSGKTVIVGHTPQERGEILDMGHLLCIDTFCFGGRWLTALDVTSGKVWQANNLGQLRS
jgi:serine/threonine protein phosphatase 1